MTFDTEKFRIKPGQMDLFDGAPYTPMVAEPTKKPAKKPKTFAQTRTSRVGKKLSAANKSMDLIQRTIEESAEILRNLGCEYIIMTKDGHILEHGTLAESFKAQTAPATPKRAPRVPPGTYSSHYKPIIEKIQPGEVAVVPFKSSLTGVNFSVSGLNSAVSAWAATHWGSGASTTFVNRKEKTIEVLRLK
jgi:hypothetical protein